MWADTIAPAKISGGLFMAIADLKRTGSPGDTVVWKRSSPIALNPDDDVGRPWRHGAGRV